MLSITPMNTRGRVYNKNVSKVENNKTDVAFRGKFSIGSIELNQFMENFFKLEPMKFVQRLGDAVKEMPKADEESNTIKKKANTFFRDLHGRLEKKPETPLNDAIADSLGMPEDDVERYFGDANFHEQILSIQNDEKYADALEKLTDGLYTKKDFAETYTVVTAPKPKKTDIPQEGVSSPVKKTKPAPLIIVKKQKEPQESLVNVPEPIKPKTKKSTSKPVNMSLKVPKQLSPEQAERRLQKHQAKVDIRSRANNKTEANNQKIEELKVKLSELKSLIGEEDAPGRLVVELQEKTRLRDAKIAASPYYESLMARQAYVSRIKQIDNEEIQPELRRIEEANRKKDTQGEALYYSLPKKIKKKFKQFMSSSPDDIEKREQILKKYYAQSQNDNEHKGKLFNLNLKDPQIEAVDNEIEQINRELHGEKYTQQQIEINNKNKADIERIPQIKQQIEKLQQEYDRSVDFHSIKKQVHAESKNNQQNKTQSALGNSSIVCNVLTQSEAAKARKYFEAQEKLADLKKIAKGKEQLGKGAVLRTGSNSEYQKLSEFVSQNNIVVKSPKILSEELTALKKSLHNIQDSESVLAERTKLDNQITASKRDYDFNRGLELLKKNVGIDYQISKLNQIGKSENPSRAEKLAETKRLEQLKKLEASRQEIPSEFLSQIDVEKTKKFFESQLKIEDLKKTERIERQKGRPEDPNSPVAKEIAELSEYVRSNYIKIKDTASIGGNLKALHKKRTAIDDPKLLKQKSDKIASVQKQIKEKEAELEFHTALTNLKRNIYIDANIKNLKRGLSKEQLAQKQPEIKKLEASKTKVKDGVLPKDFAAKAKEIFEARIRLNELNGIESKKKSQQIKNQTKNNNILSSQIANLEEYVTKNHIEMSDPSALGGKLVKLRQELKSIEAKKGTVVEDSVLQEQKQKYAELKNKTITDDNGSVIPYFDYLKQKRAKLEEQKKNIQTGLDEHGRSIAMKKSQKDIVNQRRAIVEIDQLHPSLKVISEKLAQVKRFMLGEKNTQKELERNNSIRMKKPLIEAKQAELQILKSEYELNSGILAIRKNMLIDYSIDSLRRKESKRIAEKYSKSEPPEIIQTKEELASDITKLGKHYELAKVFHEVRRNVIIAEKIKDAKKEAMPKIASAKGFEKKKLQDELNAKIAKLTVKKRNVPQGVVSQSQIEKAKRYFRAEITLRKLKNEEAKILENSGLTAKDSFVESPRLKSVRHRIENVSKYQEANKVTYSPPDVIKGILDAKENTLRTYSHTKAEKIRWAESKQAEKQALKTQLDELEATKIAIPKHVLAQLDVEKVQNYFIEKDKLATALSEKQIAVRILNHSQVPQHKKVKAKERYQKASEQIASSREYLAQNSIAYTKPSLIKAKIDRNQTMIDRMQKLQDSLINDDVLNEQKVRYKKILDSKIYKENSDEEITVQQYLEDKQKQLQLKQKQTADSIADIIELDTNISQLKNEKQNTLDRIASVTLQISRLERDNSSIAKKMDSDLKKASRSA